MFGTDSKTFGQSYYSFCFFKLEEKKCGCVRNTIVEILPQRSGAKLPAAKSNQDRMGESGQPSIHSSNPPSTNEGSNPFYNNIKFSGTSFRRSCFLRSIIILAVVFLVTAIIFIVLFAVFYTRYKDEVTATKSVCSTSDCVLAAAMLVKKMNGSADPCKDFHEYACGRFIKETIIPENSLQVSKFTVLTDEAKLIMEDIIVQDITETEPTYLSNMKKFYRSCTNETQIETIGLNPYINDQTFVSDWPTLNTSWTEANFSLDEVIARYAEVYIEPIFSSSVAEDLMNPKKMVLYLSEGERGLSKEQFDKPRNDSVIMAYEKYLAETAIALNASRTIAEQDARTVVDLEIALSKIQISTKGQLDLSKFYNPVLLANLSSMYPELDIPKAIRATFATANITLPDDETVINFDPTYIGNISSVVKIFSNRTVQNLFGFKYALSRVDSLTQKMRDISLEFDKVVTGVSAEIPRWEICLKSSSEVFEKGMGKQFVDRTFSETAKRYMEEMINNLKAEFKKMVEENTWLSQATKDQALSKLAAMRLKVGYPDVNFTDADFDRFYDHYTMSEDNYYNNRVLSNRLVTLEKMLSLKRPMDKNEWPETTYTVNALHEFTENEIIFPAGILRSPVFSQTFQDSMNYGAIGAIIGHEITHGFDNNGSHYDAEGNSRDWWEPKDRTIFLEKIQCIVDQNNNFRVDEINMTLNGNLTQGESVSDNGGLKESFRAYKQLVRKKGEQPRLPGLELNQDQLFFLAFGQLWCEKMTNQGYTQQLTFEHPPGKFRIIGSLQNSPEFAKAYNCPVGSYMNPVKKCEVW